MPRGGLLTPDDLVTSITEGSDTDAKLVILHERLKSQAARLRTTTCTVLNGNPDRTDFADQSACDEYNNSMLDKFKLLHVFFERNLSTVAAFSTNIVNEATGVLTDEHRRLFVQVLNPNIYPFSSTMAGGIIRAQHLTMSFGGVTKTVAAHFAIKMIHVFATEYYHYQKICWIIMRGKDVVTSLTGFANAPHPATAAIHSSPLNSLNVM